MGNAIKTYIIATAIIGNNGKYLIAKRAATKKFAPNQWEFISGFVDKSETANETILREIKEELGAEGNIIATSKQFSIIDNEGQWIVIPFLIRLGVKNIQVNPEDHSEIKWVSASELGNYPDLKPFLDNEGVQKFLQAQE